MPLSFDSANPLLGVDPEDDLQEYKNPFAKGYSWQHYLKLQNIANHLNA